MTLLFTYTEMMSFIDECRTVREGKPDKSFGFSFNDESRIVLTRGDQQRRELDFTQHLLANRIEILRKHLDP